MGIQRNHHAIKMFLCAPIRRNTDPSQKLAVPASPGKAIENWAGSLDSGALTGDV